MREKVIINDGEKDILVGLDYFFQHEKIRDLTKTRVSQMYLHTRVREEAMKIRSEETQEIRKGVEILSQMMKDLHGDAVGSLLINHIETQIILST